MRLKLDENFGRAIAQIFLEAGHDVATVQEQRPQPTAGLAVLRPGGRPALAALNALAHRLVQALSIEPIAGRLWVVEPERIRIHESSGEKE